MNTTGLNADGGLIALTVGATSQAIVFNVAYTALPSVTPYLISPTGATSIVPRLDYSTLTTTGVTARFTAIPASGWYLSWQSVGVGGTAPSSGSPVTSGIGTVQLFHRIGRRARGGDFTKLSLTEQTDIMEAANTALQRLYNTLPNYFKEQTQGFVLPAPLAITGVGITQFGKTITGHAFTSAQFGQTVVLDGDAAWNQIIGTADLLNPYMGATGTVGGTIYGNALYSTTYPFDRVIGNPKFANINQAPIFFGDILSGNLPSYSSWLFAQAVGVPHVCWPQVFGNSQGNTPIMVLRFAPAPDRAYAVNVRLGFWPKRITLSNYDANTALGVPDQFIEPSLIPMCLQSFMSSPAWVTRGDEAAVELRGDKGELFARNQPSQIGSPNTRLFTPVGF